MSIFINLGRRQLGKSTLALYMAHAKSPRVFIDPRAQWHGRGKIYRQEHAESMLEDLDAGRDIVVQPVDKQETVDAMASVVALYMSEDPVPGTRQLAIVLDEAGTYNLRAWDWFMRTCDPKRVDIILTAHRPKDIDTTVRAICDTWCLFRTTQKHDLESIEDRTSEDVAREVQRLDPYEFVEWDDAAGKMQIHKNPGAWKEPRAERLQGVEPRSREPRKLWED